MDVEYVFIVGIFFLFSFCANPGTVRAEIHVRRIEIHVRKMKLKLKKLTGIFWAIKYVL